MSRQLGIVLAVLVLPLVLAGPALAQGYGDPDPDPTPTPTPSGNRVQVSTPCGTIIVQGNNWGQGFVTIDREFDNPNCPGIGFAPDIRNEPAGQGRNNSSAAAGNDGVTVVPVNPDGSFTATLTVPRDTPAGELPIVISGVDELGNERTEQVTVEITPPSGELMAGLTGGTDTTAALAVATIALVVLGLVGNKIRLSRANR